MAQLSMFQQPPSIYSIHEITSYIRDLMETDEKLRDLWVQGEVSNISRPRSGHMYFTLKDEEASLRCVIWRHQVVRLSYQAQDGDQVQAHGNISVYEVGGQYQLYADDIRPAGEGLLYQEFLRLKEKLEGEGLFDLERKRAIPDRPKRIGIVTSPTGAAIRDMLDTLQRRYPLVEVVLAPAAVQGEHAPGEIISGLERLNQYAAPDVILVGRGGGSIEDLWCFNNENVARAIAASKAPVISGVGHETDFTIADFVADLRAPTPTAAAELASPERLELETVLLELQQNLVRLLSDLINESRWVVQEQAGRLLRQSPENRLRIDRQRVDEMLMRGSTHLRHSLRLKREQLGGTVQRLSALNPSAVLGRGYAVVNQADGSVVVSVRQVDTGDELRVQLPDGQFGAQVTDVE